MEKGKVSGIALAMAVAGLMGAQSQPVAAATGTTDLVHCYGVNT